MPLTSPRSRHLALRYAAPARTAGAVISGRLTASSQRQGHCEKAGAQLTRRFEAEDVGEASIAARRTKSVSVRLRESFMQGGSILAYTNVGISPTAALGSRGPNAPGGIHHMTCKLLLIRKYLFSVREGEQEEARGALPI